MSPGRNDPCPCGSGKKYKRCHLGAEDGAWTPPPPRALLTTTTGEAYQPVRLYYEVGYQELVASKLEQLGCIERDRAGDRYVWLYGAEAKDLRFAIPYKDLPRHLHPIVIGAIRFPDAKTLTLEVRSIERALEGARFFARHLGTRAILRWGRIVNQLFDGSGLRQDPARERDRIDAMLDQNVTVINWEERADAADKLVTGASSPEEAMKLRFEEAHRRDVPLVEHFPLHADEEDGDFSNLAMVLRLRGVRAVERWMGKTDTTLMTIIHRMAAEVSKQMNARSPSTPRGARP